MTSDTDLTCKYCGGPLGNRFGRLHEERIDLEVDPNVATYYVCVDCYKEHQKMIHKDAIFSCVSSGHREDEGDE